MEHLDYGVRAYPSLNILWVDESFWFFSTQMTEGAGVEKNQVKKLTHQRLSAFCFF